MLRVLVHELIYKSYALFLDSYVTVIVGYVSACTVSECMLIDAVVFTAYVTAIGWLVTLGMRQRYNVAIVANQIC